MRTIQTQTAPMQTQPAQRVRTASAAAPSATASTPSIDQLASALAALDAMMRDGGNGGGGSHARKAAAIPAPAAAAPAPQRRSRKKQSSTRPISVQQSQAQVDTPLSPKTVFAHDLQRLYPSLFGPGSLPTHDPAPAPDLETNSVSSWFATPATPINAAPSWISAPPAAVTNSRLSQEQTMPPLEIPASISPIAAVSARRHSGTQRRAVLRDAEPTAEQPMEGLPQPPPQQRHPHPSTTAQPAKQLTPQPPSKHLTDDPKPPKKDVLSFFQQIVADQDALVARENEQENRMQAPIVVAPPLSPPRLAARVTRVAQSPVLSHPASPVRSVPTSPAAVVGSALHSPVRLTSAFVAPVAVAPNATPRVVVVARPLAASPAAALPRPIAAASVSPRIIAPPPQLQGTSLLERFQAMVARNSDELLYDDAQPSAPPSHINSPAGHAHSIVDGHAAVSAESSQLRESSISPGRLRTNKTLLRITPPRLNVDDAGIEDAGHADAGVDQSGVSSAPSSAPASPLDFSSASSTFAAESNRSRADPAALSTSSSTAACDESQTPGAPTPAPGVRTTRLMADADAEAAELTTGPVGEAQSRHENAQLRSAVSQLQEMHQSQQSTLLAAASSAASAASAPADADAASSCEVHGSLIASLRHENALDAALFQEVLSQTSADLAALTAQRAEMQARLDAEASKVEQARATAREEQRKTVARIHALKKRAEQDLASEREAAQRALQAEQQSRLAAQREAALRQEHLAREVTAVRDVLAPVAESVGYTFSLPLAHEAAAHAHPPSAVDSTAELLSHLSSLLARAEAQRSEQQEQLQALTGSVEAAGQTIAELRADLAAEQLKLAAALQCLERAENTSRDACDTLSMAEDRIRQSELRVTQALEGVAAAEARIAQAEARALQSEQLAAQRLQSLTAAETRSAQAEQLAAQRLQSLTAAESRALQSENQMAQGLHTLSLVESRCNQACETLSQAEARFKLDREAAAQNLQETEKLLEQQRSFYEDRLHQMQSNHAREMASVEQLARAAETQAQAQAQAKAQAQSSSSKKAITPEHVHALERIGALEQEVWTLREQVLAATASQATTKGALERTSAEVSFERLSAEAVGRRDCWVVKRLAYGFSVVVCGAQRDALEAEYQKTRAKLMVSSAVWRVLSRSLWNEHLRALHLPLSCVLGCVSPFFSVLCFCACTIGANACG